MQQSVLQFLEELFSRQSLPVYQTRHERLQASFFRKREAAEWVEENYKQLAGQGNFWDIEFTLPPGLETEKIRISLDDALHFNRFRSSSLQSNLYQQYQPVWLENYRRFCRSQERECLKAGSMQRLWTSAEAEKHFGMAGEAGDLSGSGAPGWKLQAFRAFLADVYFLHMRREQKFIRLSVFERLMVQGRLIPLQQLLISRSESSRLYLQKFLGRQLEVLFQQEGKA